MPIKVQRPSGDFLFDDKKRNVDGEAVRFLDKFYNGWKEPTEIKMVPMEYPALKKKDRKGYEAEKVIFDKLEVTLPNEPMFVVHSYKFKERKEVRLEHDFVLLHQKLGVIFMEVKASMNHYKDGCNQLKRDMKSIQNFLGKCLGIPPKVEAFTRCFVAMPNSTRNDYQYDAVGLVKEGCESVDAMPNSPKIDYAVPLLKEDCESVEAFSSWWENNVKNSFMTGFTQQIYECLVRRLVMDYLLFRF